MQNKGNKVVPFLVPDKKKVVAIKEGQYVVYTKDELKSVTPFFKNLVECVGVVITLTNGSKIWFKELSRDVEEREYNPRANSKSRAYWR